MSSLTFFAELKRRNVLRAAAFYAASAWLLVQVATQVFPFFHVAEWVVRWIVVASIVGFPFMIAFAWFYELTPEGFKRDSEVEAGESIRRHTGKTLDRWIIAVLVLVVVLLLANQLVLHKNPVADTAAVPARSIAVLPFVNESGDSQQDYFSDGLAEELIADLTQIGKLKVIGRNSSFHFRGKEQDDTAAIGRKLGVATLLEGTVRKLGDQVRIVVGLVRASDGSSIWSQSYDRQLRDVFAVQSDIASSVAGALKATLLGKIAESGEKPPSGDIGAYNALLQGNFYLERTSADNFHKAIGFYNEAIHADARYALAYAKLSFVWRALADQYLGGSEQADAYSKARSAAKTALELDPNLAFAHVVSGWLLMDVDFDLVAAEGEFRRAIALSPADADAKNGLAVLLAGLGRLDESTELARQALAVDPLHGSWYTNLAAYLIPQGRLDEALQAIHKAIELQPEAVLNHTLLAIIEIQRGAPGPALQAAREEGESMWRRYAMALALQAGGNRVAADAALQALIDKDATVAPFQVASVYAFRKQPDKAFEWLDRAWAARDPGVTGLLYDPFLIRYKDDPRFAAYCKKVGLPIPGQRPTRVPTATPSMAPDSRASTTSPSS